MKKYFFFLAAAAMFTACSSDDFIGDENASKNPDGVISFGSQTPNMTRATKNDGEAATALNNRFYVYGTKQNGTAAAQTVFDNYLLTYTASTAGTTTSNTDDWEYVGNIAYDGKTAQTIKYWDYTSGNKYVFTAISAPEKDMTKEGEGSVQFTANANETSKLLDSYTLTLAQNASTSGIYFSDKNIIDVTGTNTKVELVFRKFESKVRVGFYETIPGFKVKINKFYVDGFDKNTTATAKITHPSTSGGQNVYMVTYDDNNHAKLTQTTTNTAAELAFGTKITSATQLAENAATATMEDLVDVLPNPGNNGVMTIKIDYTMTADDSGETINVNGATVIVPKEFLAWQPNYAYTYLFKITDDKLTPITFDASVEEEQVYESQTVTLFEANSITTYAEDESKFTLGTGVYKTGAMVYTVAAGGNGVAIQVTASDASLSTAVNNQAGYYKITATEGFSLDDVNEDVVLKELTTEASYITLTYQAGELATAIPYLNGTTVAVNNALKGTLSEAGKYAYIYMKDNTTTPKTYGIKVITVQ